MAKLHFGAHFQAPGLPNQTAGTVDVYGLQILDATLETGNAVEAEEDEAEEDTAVSALLLKHEFLDGGADDVTLATLGKVLLEPTLTTLGNFLVRSNSQSSVASASFTVGGFQLEPSNEVGRASTKGPLGEPVLIGRARTHWASPYSLGLGEPVLGEPVLGEPSNEPSNEVGRASTKGAVGRATQLSQPPRLLQSCACSAHLLSACSARFVKCQLGTVPARHVRCLPTSARSALCLLDTFS